MHIAGQASHTPPPSFGDWAAQFGPPVFSFTPRPNLELIGGGMISTGDVIIEVDASYVFFANPANRDDPVNLRPLRADEIDYPDATVAPQQWIRDMVALMRYPQLWECVRTSVPDPDARPRSLPERLGEHIDHLARNSPVYAGGWPPPFPDPEAIDWSGPEATVILVDGREADAFALAGRGFHGRIAEVGGRILSVVIPEALADRIELSFETWSDGETV